MAEPLEPMQHRVEHPVRPLHVPPGHLTNPLEDRVAVAVLLGQDRQDDRGRGGGDQVLVDLHDSPSRGRARIRVYIAALYMAALGITPGASVRCRPRDDLRPLSRCDSDQLAATVEWSTTRSSVMGQGVVKASVAALAGCGLLLGAWPAQAASPSFRGTVGPEETIGVSPRPKKAGTYRFVVRDLSGEHNFRLRVPGLNVATVSRAPARRRSR